MSVPYTPGMIASILRLFTDAQLAATSPEQFQLWPARNIVPPAWFTELRPDYCPLLAACPF